MGKIFESISGELKTWITEQKIFFVSTAPLSEEGHINCSPKGGNTFRILGSQEVAYLDLTGSGIETIAHLQENGRILIMFCAMDGPPRIVRMHGKGEVIYPDNPSFPLLLTNFTEQTGIRSIIRVRLTRISDSCGFGVPRYEYLGERDAMAKWLTTKGEPALADYRSQKNKASIDKLPGYCAANGRSARDS